MMVDNEYVCSICLEAFFDTRPEERDGNINNVCSYTPCGHLFHTHCILEWFERKRNWFSSQPHGPCPLCRENFTAVDLVPVTLDANNNYIVVAPAPPPIRRQHPVEGPVLPQNVVNNDNEIQNRMGIQEAVEISQSFPEKVLWAVIGFSIGLAFWGLYGDIILDVVDFLIDD